jgi:hypothetical protein
VTTKKFVRVIDLVRLPALELPLFFLGFLSLDLGRLRLGIGLRRLGRVPAALQADDVEQHHEYDDHA